MSDIELVFGVHYCHLIFGKYNFYLHRHSSLFNAFWKMASSLLSIPVSFRIDNQFYEKYGPITIHL